MVYYVVKKGHTFAMLSPELDGRCDLLCLEGLAQALRIFNGLDPIPIYNVANISSESMLKIHVKTEALLPPEINFIPLKQTKNFRADELMEFYKSDMKLKKFLHIIENSPVFSVIYDHSRTVLSLPPIINGAYSAISLETKNVFIKCTATDLTKANIVLNTMVTMFSVYCETKFAVEPVEVIYPDGKSYICPDLSLYHIVVPLSYITGAVGVSLPAHEVAGLLNESKEKQTIFTIYAPLTRSDILRPCDVAEDVAIAYGDDEIPKMKLPSLKPH